MFVTLPGADVAAVCTRCEVATLPAGAPEGWLGWWKQHASGVSRCRRKRRGTDGVGRYCNARKPWTGERRICCYRWAVRCR